MISRQVCTKRRNPVVWIDRENKVTASIQHAVKNCMDHGGVRVNEDVVSREFEEGKAELKHLAFVRAKQCVAVAKCAAHITGPNRRTRMQREERARRAAFLQ